MERFAVLLRNALSKSGRRAIIVDIDALGGSRKIARTFRYSSAWRIGRHINGRASPGDAVVCSNFFSWNARRDHSIVVYHGTDMGRAISTRSEMGFLRNATVRTIGTFLEKRTGRGRTGVTVSNSAKEEVEKDYGLRVDAVIPNAGRLDMFRPADKKRELRERFGLPKDKFLMLFVGTPDPRKGLGWIFEELVPRFNAGQHLVVRSDTTLTSKSGTVVGRLPLDQLADLYRACDVFLFPTLYEGYSFTLVEALACGLPAVTSPAGGGRDLLDVPELRAFIISRKDPDAYMKCLERLQSSKEEYAQASSAARAYAEKNCSIPHFEKAYVELIEKALAR